MNLVKSVTDGVKMMTSKTGLKVVKHSPEILVVAGIVGGISAAVMACRATLKVNMIIDDYRDTKELMVMSKDDPEIDYDEKDYKDDKTKLVIQTGWRYIKLYGPAVTLGIASIVCIFSGHNILKKRNVALAAAYNLVEKAFSDYRGKVISEFGEQKDHEYRFGIKEEEVTETIVDEKTGKKKTVKKKVQSLKGVECSMYARLFEQAVHNTFDGSWEGSTQWQKVHNYNIMTLTAKERYFNDILNTRGYVFLNDVYEELGFPRSQEGQLVGWTKGGAGDGYVSFGPFYQFEEYQDGDSILLDFNVDGLVLDQI